MEVLLQPLGHAFSMTLLRVYGDWGWRKHSPVECRSWPGFRRAMVKMCAESHLRPEHFPSTDRADRRGAFDNTWGI